MKGAAPFKPLEFQHWLPSGPRRRQWLTPDDKDQLNADLLAFLKT